MIEERMTEKERNALAARQQRNMLLADTDKVVLRFYESNVVVPNQWVVYRQALRDLPQQVGFPNEIVWPNKPE